MALTDDLRAIKRADVDYLIAHDYYEGRRIPELFSSPFLARTLGKDSAKWQVNIASRPVDAVMFKLEVLGVSVTRNGAEDTASATSFRENVVDPNLLLQVVSDAMTLAEEHGDSYLLVWDDVSEETSTAVDVLAYGPVGARLFYDVDSERRKDRWIRTWMMRGEGSTDDQTTWYRRVNIVDAFQVRKLIGILPGNAMSEDEFKPFDGEDTLTVLEDGTLDVPEPGVVPHPYGELPVFHLRTRRPYGVPEHACVYGLQNMLNKDLATLAESVDGFGVPFRFRLMELDTQLRAGTDVFGDNDGEADSQREETVRTQAGSLANLRNTTAVGQLTPADVSNLLEPVDKIMQLASTVSVTPLDYFDATAAAASGESRKEHKDAFHAKCETRRKDFDITLVDALEFAANVVLQLPGVTIELEWKPVQERSKEEQYTQVGLAIANGMPWVEAWVEAGYDREEVEEWTDPTMTPDAVAGRLKVLSEAVKNFAAAAQLGVGTPDGVTQLMRDAVAPPQPRRAVTGG